MTGKPSPERQGDDKAEASETTPMERFRNLARRLVSVTPEEVAKEQAKYESAKTSSPRRGPLRSV